MQYDLGAGIRTGCYACTTVPDQAGSGAESRKFSWNRDSGDTLSLLLGKVLDLSGALATAKSGSISLDSVVIRTSQDVVPNPESCSGITADGLPVLPAITQLVGAKVVRIQTTASFASDLAAKYQQQGVADARSSKDTTIVTFSGLRWLGVRLMGFNLTETDSSRGPLRLGETTRVPHQMQVGVSAAGADSFAIIWQRTIPGAQPHKITVGAGVASVFGVPSSSASSAFGLITVSRTNQDSVAVTIRWLKYSAVAWTMESQRNDVQDWMNQRSLMTR
jgi:hypothetical protein